MCVQVSIKAEKASISVKKDCYINSSMKLLTTITFYLTFDKQLSEIIQH